MKIIPAIDLINEQCVRLTKGDYSKKSVYTKTPLEQAIEFEKDGADILHIVDLDAAKSGTPENLDVILEIRKNINIPMQIGGGIRNMETARKYLESGVDRIIIGTKAVENMDFITELIQEFGNEKIVIGVDILGNDVKISGWEKSSNTDYKSFCRELKTSGVKNLVVTDISRDGTLTEPNFDLCEEISNLGFDVIASGGVSSVCAIKELKSKNTWGAILGKALYEGMITLQDITQ